MSAPEDQLAWQLDAVKIPYSREFRFWPERKFRADFAVTTCKHGTHVGTFCLPLLVEVDGGAFSGGRHTSGAGFRKDLEKHNAMTMLGYKCLRFLPEQVSDGSALVTIEAALGSAPSPTGGPE
jgi:very-short-patch-repair endonuclease